MPKWGNRRHAWYGVFSPGGEFLNGVPPAYDRLDLKNIKPPPCRTLADMTEEEIQDIERRYGMPVIRPSAVRSCS